MEKGGKVKRGSTLRLHEINLTSKSLETIIIIMDVFAILLIVLATLGLYHLLKSENPFKEHGLPYKSYLPILGSTWESILKRKPFAVVIQEIYNLAPSARYVGFYNRMTPVVMIRDPELIKAIAVKNFDVFRNHRTVNNVQTDDILLSGNLLLLRDNRWKEVRSLNTPAFSSSKIRSMHRSMSEIAVNVAKYLSTLPSGQNVVEMKDVFARYANDVFAICAFGITVDSLSDRENKFYELGREALDIHSTPILKLILIFAFPKLARRLGVTTLVSKEATNFFTQVVSENIRMREEGSVTRSDFVQVMMDSERWKSKRLTVEDITAQAFAFFFGGFETTSGLLSFAAHELAANPEIQAKVHAEIDRVLVSSNEITFERVNGLGYLDAVINETLRMYPIIPITDRECSKWFELPPALPDTKPYVLKEGSHVCLPIYAIQRDPRHFEKPDCFDPDRFLGNKKKGNDAFNDDAYIPFGTGPRSCIGNRFSMVETKVALFHILARCRLEVCSKTTIPMELRKRGVFLTAKNGFWLRIVPRHRVM